MARQSFVAFCAPALTAVLMVGCGGSGGNRDSAPGDPPDLAGVTDAIPRAEPASRYGNPRSYEVFGKRYQTLASSEGYQETGIASWYGTKFHGRATSSGEPYDMYAMTAAHKSLPIPTYVRVTDRRNGNSVVVRVNDRGPFHNGRIIDLSYAAATRLGIHKAGTAKVEVVALPPYQSLNGRGHRKAQPKPASAGTSKPASIAVVRSVPAGNMYLQMGAFSDRTNAERMLRELDALVPGRVRVHIQPEGAALYRVRVGPLADRETETLQAQLANGGYPSSHVVIE
jgi:rare lipoprotein A